MVNIWLMIVNHILVGGRALPLWKMMKVVSWDDEIPNWMESHKIPWFQSPPSSILYVKPKPCMLVNFKDTVIQHMGWHMGYATNTWVALVSSQSTSLQGECLRMNQATSGKGQVWSLEKSCVILMGLIIDLKDTVSHVCWSMVDHGNWNVTKTVVGNLATTLTGGHDCHQSFLTWKRPYSHSCPITTEVIDATSRRGYPAW